MILDRLTDRAKTALFELPKRKKVSTVEVLDSIKKAEGMGSYLISSLPNIQLPKDRIVETEKLVKEAYYQSVKFEHPYVGTEHLLLGLLRLTSSRDINKVKLELMKLNVFPNTVKNMEKGKKTPILDSFSENLNQKAIKSLDRTLVHRVEYDTLVASLLLKSSSNVLLIGDAGVGKRTLVDILARNITALDVPPILAGYQVIDFDLVSFLTSVFNKGGIDLGLAALSDELRSMGRVIFSIKNFQNIFFATSTGLAMPMFYSMFKNVLDASGSKLIATMNTSLYEKVVGENDHIIEDFTIVEVKEPSEKETIKILDATASQLGEFHGVEIPTDVLKQIYKKARIGSSDVKFPQRGIDLMDHSCTHLILRKSKIPQSYKKLVDKSFELLNSLDEHVERGHYDNALKMRNDLRGLEAKLVNKEEKIFVGDKLVLTVDDVNEAVKSFSDERRDENDNISMGKLSALADNIKKKIIGQEHAVDSVVKSLIRARLSLRSRKRTLGNFLFLGPTGVGKTELAKVLADEFFGEKSLIRLDMSDFAEKHNVARLVGAPPGYVGYGEGGELTTKIENRPDSVVLFDEIEKAHPDVLNILLQIMEEAELADAKGNIFDFSRAVIILTSNSGTEILHASEIGFGDKVMTDKGTDSRLRLNLKKILKPELINRFDDVIIFHKLRKESQFRVLEILIKEIIATLSAQKIKLVVSNQVKNYLLKTGFSEEYGARAMKRSIEKELLDKIAEFLLKHRTKPLELVADVERGDIVITGKTPVKKKPVKKSKKVKSGRK